MQLPPASRTRQVRGFALIDLLFVIAIIGVLAGLATPGLMRARASANAVSAIASLRLINGAQITYAITCGSGFYAPDLVTLGTVPPGAGVAFVPQDLGSANIVIKSNFQIELASAGAPGSPASCNGVAAGQGGTGYRARADSIDPTLSQFYSTNASGTIYQANVALFAATPESGPPAFGTPIE